MYIDVNMWMLTAFFLVFIRLSALFLLSPVLSVTQVPLRLRNLMLLALAATLVVSLQIVPANVPQTFAQLLQAAVHEFVVGAIMAFGLFAAFAAFLVGGRVLDFQMGFGVANLIDPATNAQAPLLGTVLNLMAIAVFFMVDGHHYLIRGIAYSLNQIPIGQGLTKLKLDAVVAQFGLMFVYGIALVAPAIFTLLLLDVGLAIAARTMPQVNIFIVGLPLKIFVGLLVLTLSLQYMSPLLKKVFQSIFRYWERVLG